MACVLTSFLIPSCSPVLAFLPSFSHSHLLLWLYIMHPWKLPKILSAATRGANQPASLPAAPPLGSPAGPLVLPAPARKEHYGAPK